MLCSSFEIKSRHSDQTTLRENLLCSPMDGFCKMGLTETKMIDANAVILLNVLKPNYTPQTPDNNKLALDKRKL